MNKLSRFTLTALLPLITASCVTVSFEKSIHTADPYTTDPQKLKTLKEQKVKKLSVATVKPFSINSPLNKVAIRDGMELVSPSGTFARYLQDAITSDLTASGTYSPNTDYQLQIEILENKIDAPMFDPGTRQLRIRLQILKGEKKIFEKNYTATQDFHSKTLAKDVVDDAKRFYPLLVQTLFSKIYNDKNFLEIIKE